ncbi:hypothetical protein JTE90_027706 [Oedothorax gibbosus]|uniref:Uncharacterized protein n=1 Tax=Oedothorax gibbosus TaxID=931172 RepID=A0AAV6UUD0_9ARAC|nr:hypothetical protein JTE90_027706 [Oedothorax gibbosus]
MKHLTLLKERGRSILKKDKLNHGNVVVENSKKLAGGAYSISFCFGIAEKSEEILENKNSSKKIRSTKRGSAAYNADERFT